MFEVKIVKKLCVKMDMSVRLDVQKIHCEVPLLCKNLNELLFDKVTLSSDIVHRINIVSYPSRKEEEPWECTTIGFEKFLKKL